MMEGYPNPNPNPNPNPDWRFQCRRAIFDGFDTHYEFNRISIKRNVELGYYAMIESGVEVQPQP